LGIGWVWPGEPAYVRPGQTETAAYNSDYIVELRFDNFGKRGRLYLRCVADLQKRLRYMETDDRDWKGSTSGVTYYHADGSVSTLPPNF